jgi:hypothetical protein
VADFLDEVDGDFVKHLRASSAIAALVGSSTDARIFPEMARQGAELPHIIYTQAAGSMHKSHSGRTGDKEWTLHVYCFGATQPAARALANLLEPYLNDIANSADTTIGSGTKIKTCNGEIVDCGVEPAANSSDVKKFWVRLVVRFLIG